MIEIQQEIERLKKAGVPITCKAGCGGCCHVKVSCTKQEVKHIISLGVDIDMDKLQNQVKDWDSSDKNCVFLKQGNCSIHYNKPLTCVGHLVNSPAENCAINSGKPVNMIRIKKIENIITKRKGTVLLHEELFRLL